MRTRMSELAVLVVYVLTLPALVALLATSFLSPTTEQPIVPTPLPTQAPTPLPTNTPTPLPRSTSTPITDALLRDLDLSTFAQIPSMRQIDYGTIPLDLQPVAGYDYWELRQAGLGWGERDHGYVVLAQGGSRARAELSPSLVAEIDATETGFRVRGFGRECPPARCFKYVVFVRSNKVGEVLRLAELHAFLGEIDTQDEAILVVEALGYGWGDTREEAAIREVTNGYDLVVLDWWPSAEKCEDGGERYDTYRFLLHLSRSGISKVQARELLIQGRDCAVA